MKEFFERAFENMIGRRNGTMNFRLIIQPLLAILFAVRAGLRDSKAGYAPFFWNYRYHKENRKLLVKQGWADIGKVFIMAFVLDVIYQFIAIKSFYPGEAVLTAIILALMPYLIFRPLTTLIANQFRKNV